MIAMAVSLSLGAVAQDQFPDVPANHWAYEALEVLKRDGILVGYPDGKYRGTRLATRYEMAVAIHAAYKRMMSMHEGLADQVKALEAAMGTGTGDASGLLKELKAQVDGMKNWGDDVATLKKMVEEFEKELTGLGADVDKIKATLGDLEGRVSNLEKKMNVSITGDANFLVFAGNARDKVAGMNKEGRIVGVNEKAANSQTGLTRDLNVYHELALNLKNGNDKDAVKWNATIVFGNMIGTGNAAGNGPVLADLVNMPGGGYTDNNQMDIYIPDLGVSFDTSIGGVGFNAAVGRIGKKVSPMMFQRADNTLYFDNDRWDDGKYRMDGAWLGFKFGGVDLELFGGRNSERHSNNGTDINPINLPGLFATPNGNVVAPGYNGGAKVDATLGAQIGFNIGTQGRINAAYLLHDTYSTGGNANNRLNVFGVDGNYNISGFKIAGGYSKSIVQKNSTNAFDKKNQAAFVNVGYDATNWGAWAEYRKIQTFYAAAGNWRRIGTFWNPTNIETFTGHVYFKPNAALKVYATGEFGETIDAIGANKPKIESIIAGVKYNMTNGWTAKLEYEDVKIKTNPNIKQRWATLGLGYNLSTNALLSLAYEYGSVNNQAFGWGGGAPGSYKGGFLTSQLTLKF